MLSRTADSLFWLNRYMERADSMVRVIKTNYTLALDKGVNDTLTWKPSLELFAAIDKNAIDSFENDTKEALHCLLLDTENINSFKILITRARENARGVQDHITKEVWEQVNQLYHLVNQSAFTRKLTSFNAMEAIDVLTKSMIQYSGVTETTMARGMGWSFMNLGRHTERCLLTAEITDRQYSQINYDIVQASDILQWRYLLLSLSGYELYLKNYRTSNHNHKVLDQVIFNHDFTRSIIYALSRIEKYLNDVISENNYSENVPLLHSFGRLYSLVRYTDADSINNDSLKIFLAEIKSQIINFIKSLQQNFFSYS